MKKLCGPNSPSLWYACQLLSIVIMRNYSGTPHRCQVLSGFTHSRMEKKTSGWGRKFFVWKFVLIWKFSPITLSFLWFFFYPYSAFIRTASSSAWNIPLFDLVMNISKGNDKKKNQTMNGKLLDKIISSYLKRNFCW